MNKKILIIFIAIIAVVAVLEVVIGVRLIQDNKAQSETIENLEATIRDLNKRITMLEHDGVARHPGDKGMKYIADAVIKVLG